jgi:hypothetical protein
MFLLDLLTISFTAKKNLKKTQQQHKNDINKVKLLTFSLMFRFFLFS